MDMKIAQFSVKTTTVPTSFSVSNDRDRLIYMPLDRYNFEKELNVSALKIVSLFMYADVHVYLNIHIYIYIYICICIYVSQLIGRYEDLRVQAEKERVANFLATEVFI
jgi:hypothetical protein